MLNNLITPPWCRWDDAHTHKLTVWHCVLYAFAGGFFSANLFYSHPILDILAHDFNTTQSGVANIPTLAQAGEAAGILLVLPLADFFPRRKFSLLLLSFTIAFWVGLPFTSNLAIFSALTFLSAIPNGVTNVFMVLVAEMSPADRRAFNISIVGCGPTLGILLARILSGIVATYVPWRFVYIMALCVQVLMLILLFLFMPDYPPSNARTVSQIIKSYPKMLVSILTLNFRHPVLMQASILIFVTFFTVSSFWTTLTFLLSARPFSFNPFVIGLFGLIAAPTLVLGPVYGKYIIQPINTPLLSASIGMFTSMIGIVIGTFAGKTSVAGPVVQAVLLDAGLIITTTANRVAIHDIEPNARNQVNTAYVIMLFLGLLSGTKAGNDVYEKYGGWYASGGLSLGIILFGFVVILARGPHEKSWIGWSGGWARTKPDAGSGSGSECDIESRTESICVSADVEKSETVQRVVEQNTKAGHDRIEDSNGEGAIVSEVGSRDPEKGNLTSQ